MFVLTTIADTVRIPPSMFVHPVLQSVHLEIEKKFPNRVLMDVGLVICRYGDALEIGDGVCVAGDGGAHHECVFRMVIFRPFVEEVCIGTIVESNEEGIRVSLGEFFDQVHIPAYWMLRPSHFNHHSSLWIWTPQYDDDDDEEEEDDNEDTNDKDNDENNDKDNIDNDENNDKDNKENIDKDDKDSIDKDNGENNEEEKQADANQFEMYIGAEIRFKVKAINFTQVTNTAKGVQATTTTTSHSNAAKMAGPLDTAASTNLNNNNNNNNKDGTNNNKNKSSTDDTSSKPLRKRSTSVDLSDAQRIPATMHITASICEDGLGLTSWWKSTADEEDEENEEQGDEGEEEQADNEENEQHGEPE